MSRFLNFCLLFILSLTGVFSGTLFISIQQLDVNQHKSEIIQAVKDKTGRDFQIKGDLRLELSLTPVLIAENVSFGNASWGSKRNMVSVKRFIAKVSLIPLLQGEVSINSLTLINPDIYLERNNKEIGNWAVNKSEDAVGIKKYLTFNINKIEIENAKFFYRNRKYNRDTIVEVKKIVAFNKVNSNIFKETDLRNSEIRADNAKFTFKDKKGNQTVVNNNKIVAVIENKKDISDISYIRLKEIHAESSKVAYSHKKSGKYVYAVIASASATRKIKSKSIGSGSKDRFLINGKNVALQIKIKKKTEDIDIRNLTALTRNIINDTLDLKIKGTYRNTPLIVEGKFDPISKIVHNRKYHLDADTKLGEVNISLNGYVERPREIKKFHFNTNLETDNLKDLNSFFNKDLPDIGPISISGNLSDDNDKSYQLSSMNADIAQNDLSGDVKMFLSGKRTKIKATIISKDLDLNRYKTQNNKNRDEPFLSSKPLPFDNLKYVNLDLDLTSEKITLGNITLIKSDIDLSLNNGRLKIDIAKANFADGNLTAMVDMAPDNNTMSLNTKVSIKQLQIDKIPQLKEKHYINEGRTDVYFTAKSTGKDMKTIMSGLNGNLLVQMGQGEINNSALKFPGSKLLLSSRKDYTKLQCGVVALNIENGIAKSDNRIALETENVSMIGSGHVNLNTGELDLNIRPQAIGLSTSQLTDYVSLGGTITKPVPRVDKLETLKTAAKIGAAIATSGISLIAGVLYDTVTTDRNPCLSAVES